MFRHAHNQSKSSPERDASGVPSDSSNVDGKCLDALCPGPYKRPRSMSQISKAVIASKAALTARDASDAPPGSHVSKVRACVAAAAAAGAADGSAAAAAAAALAASVAVLMRCFCVACIAYSRTGSMYARSW